jgi:hypothetical protein
MGSPGMLSYIGWNLSAFEPAWREAKGERPL